MAKQLIKLTALASALFAVSCSNQVAQDERVKTKKGPKNVILMISDGIGFNGWLAGDYYQGLAGKQSYQITRPDGTKPRIYGLAHSALNLTDKSGEVLPKGAKQELVDGAVEQGYDPRTRWQSFENSMLNDYSPVEKSYTSYTDSAAAGTALMSGRKTSVGRVNVDWSGKINFDTIAQIAMKQGRSAGAVSSVMISHATPAAVIAHNTSRNNYADIFNEMVTSGLSVLIGTGHPLYDSNGKLISELEDKHYKYLGGQQTYLELTSEKGFKGYTFIDDKADFEKVAEGKQLPTKLIGIARSGSTLQASRENKASANTPSGMAFNTNVPDLPTMSKAALNVLNQDKDGFFVMIEGGAIDWMGHANDMPRFIEEQVDFNKSVDAVIEWVEQNSNWEETILIITSDHECGGVWGEGTWTNSAGGPVATERTDAALAEARFDPKKDKFNNFIAVQDKGAGNIPGFQFASPNHTNELVPLWVLGAGAERFEQFTRKDQKAQKLWGKQYNWNGKYVDNTSVFDVMKTAVFN